MKHNHCTNLLCIAYMGSMTKGACCSCTEALASSSTAPVKHTLNSAGSRYACRIDRQRLHAKVMLGRDKMLRKFQPGRLMNRCSEAPG